MLRHALAATATIAPHIGALFTIYGILGSFKGCPCGASAEDRLASIVDTLAESLIPFAIGLLIGLAAKIIHGGDPMARHPQSPARTDFAAFQLAQSMHQPRFTIPQIGRGGLETLPMVSRCARILAGLLFGSAFKSNYPDPWYFFAVNIYDGTLAAFAFAVALSLLARYSYDLLDRKHAALIRETEYFVLARPSFDDDRARWERV